ncbi:hypothetical protein AN958_02129 [Leucoagaricus sp. SymC.cos]|nr:hypothetical protein AN958_02129 [Leucoagaricus sp. SymC.cos]
MPDLEAPSSSSPLTRPDPLSLVIDDDDDQRPLVTYSGRPSHRSSPSSDSPVYESAVDPTTPLILAHNDDDDDEEEEEDRDAERPLALDFSSSDEDNDDLDDSLSPLYQINGKLSIPPLPPFTIFVYLLSPYLKLGALLLPYYQLPLKYGLSGLLISAVVAVVARHLLYLLSRYLRKADLEDVVSHTFVSTKKRGRKGERRREFFKFLVRFGTAALRVLLTVVYLHECVHFALPLIMPVAPLRQSSTELGLAMGAIVLALLLSYPGSLASRVVVYSTNLSVFTYLLWLVAVTYLYTQGTLPINPERLNSRSIWEGLITTAFIFTSSNTLPLYASTKGTIQSLLFDAETSLTLPTSGTTPSTGNSRRDGSLKQPLYRSFKFLSLLSIAMAVGLTLPLVGFAAFPNNTPSAPASGTGIQTYVTPALASLTLLLAVPQLLITIPTFPAATLAILATYYFPAILHILDHTFKSPLSIILPSTYFSSSFSVQPTPSTTIMNLPTPGPSSGLGVNAGDILLQRKERALQKRQMRRRIVWDIWAWVIFFGGFVVLGAKARILGSV